MSCRPRGSVCACVVLGVVFLTRPVESQICNGDDPLSGGIFIPAFGSGGTVVCVKNASGVGYMPNADGTACVRSTIDPQGTAVLYAILLAWTFMGVAIIADVFMESISVITSRSRWIEVDADVRRAVEPESVDMESPKMASKKQIEIRTWNPTVANLTLMALGSSAPEILLSCIELVRNDFFAGALGPGTIVGSAAFNLFVIVAVCVVAPGAATRKIDELLVFAVTGGASILAYLWLLFIVAGHTKNVVGIAEAGTTFLMFPVLVIAAYLANQYKGKEEDGSEIARSPRLDQNYVTGIGSGADQKNFQPYMVAQYLKDMNLTDIAIGGQADDDENAAAIAMAIAQSEEKPSSYLEYRMKSAQGLTGTNASVATVGNLQKQGVESSLNPLNGVPKRVGFSCAKYKGRESNGKVSLSVTRVGDASAALTLFYSTREATENDGVHKANTATKDEDYVHKDGTLEFAAGESDKDFDIEIMDDNVVEHNEVFFVDITSVVDPPDVPETRRIKSLSTATILIIDDDAPGEIEFEETELGEEAVEYRCSEGEGMLDVTVRRVNGSKGEVKCRYQTRRGTATPGTDYADTYEDTLNDSGILTFRDQECVKTISVQIFNGSSFEKEETFSLILMEPMEADGPGELSSLLKANIVITHDDIHRSFVQSVFNKLHIDGDRFKLGSRTWGRQFTDALTVPPDAGCPGTVMHYLSLPWKVAFSVVPPAFILNGWLRFSVAIILVGCVTALIGDLAALLGCCIGIKDSVTAITLVALGTSLPDLFASKMAVVNDKTADASIGNVTGSNAVNVFLGIGLPWTIAAIYWWDQGPTQEWREVNTEKYPGMVLPAGGGFVVPSGDLGFSVAVFAIEAIIVFIVLGIRRKVFGAELGGTDNMTIPTAIFLVLLWVTYVTLSTLNAYEKL